MRSRRWAWLAVGLATLLAWAAFFALPPSGRWAEVPKHLLTFGAWAATLVLALRTMGIAWTPAVLWTAGLGIVAAAVGEWVQVLVPERHSAEWRGFWWSCVGVGVGVAVGWGLGRIGAGRGPAN